jgi:hypothetical protein
MACTRYGGASFKQTEAILVVVTAALKRCHGDDSRGDKFAAKSSRSFLRLDFALIKPRLHSN